MRSRLIILSCLGVAACATPPPVDFPYLRPHDSVRLVTAIDEALVTGEAVPWRAEDGAVYGTAVPTTTYEDWRGRPCRAVDYSIDGGDGIYTQSGKYCRDADGVWLPDVPPGGSSITVPLTDRAPTARVDLDLRRAMLVDLRRLQRRHDSRAEARRQFRKLYSLEERRRAGF